MSWELFKNNILARANNPDSIKDIDTVAKLYATEYDACMKRGGDTLNRVAVKNGDVKTMEQFFKAALQKGLSSTQPYDLVGEMGKGVLAYWGTAILNEFPIPLTPSPGSTSNIAVLSNKVTVPGTWLPPQPSAGLPNTPTQTQPNPNDEAEDPFAREVVPVEYPITQRVFADELEEENFDTNNKDVDFSGAVLKAQAWAAGDKNQSFSKAIGADYSGYTVGPLSASDTIKKIYVPALNKVHADKSKGVRMLMTAQTQLEGFYPANANRGASLSFRTNNPGNVNTNGITIGKFATLEDGIAAQWNKVLGPVYTGQPKPSPYYKTSYTLFEYLSTYAPVMAKDRSGNWYKTTNNPTNYTNFVINYFKGQGYTITAQTTLAEINKIM
jgi:hypothetical protein